MKTVVYMTNLSFVLCSTDAIKLFFNRVHRNDVITDHWFNRNATLLNVFGN